MLDIFLFVLALGGTFCTILGVVTLVYWVKPAKKPNDESNRINNIMSWWIGMTRPEVMGEAYKAFRQDVLDNLEDSNNEQF